MTSLCFAPLFGLLIRNVVQHSGTTECLVLSNQCSVLSSECLVLSIVGLVFSIVGQVFSVAASHQVSNVDWPAG